MDEAAVVCDKVLSVSYVDLRLFLDSVRQNSMIFPDLFGIKNARQKPVILSIGDLVAYQCG